MAVLTPTLLKVEIEGDLQVLNLKFSSVTDGDTYSAAGYFTGVTSVHVCGSTAAAQLAVAEAAGVLTFKVNSGTPSAFVRIAGN